MYSEFDPQQHKKEKKLVFTDFTVVLGGASSRTAGPSNLCTCPVCVILPHLNCGPSFGIILHSRSCQDNLSPRMDHPSHILAQLEVPLRSFAVRRQIHVTELFGRLR